MHRITNTLENSRAFSLWSFFLHLVSLQQVTLIENGVVFVVLSSFILWKISTVVVGLAIEQKKTPRQFLFSRKNTWKKNINLITLNYSAGHLW